MTLEQLMDPDKELVNDQTTITVAKGYKSYGSQLKRKGNWYQDHILDLMQEEIRNFEMDLESNELTVLLK